LNAYNDVTYLGWNNPSNWGKAIINEMDNEKNKVSTFNKSNYPSWESLFEIVKNNK